jgi:hypothetical protein
MERRASSAERASKSVKLQRLWITKVSGGCGVSNVGMLTTPSNLAVLWMRIESWV